jgi:hypothetical protein
MQLVYQEYATASHKDITQTLTPRLRIPGLQTGRTFTLDVAADDGEYKLFLDGVQVADVHETRYSAPSIPQVVNQWAAAGQTGVLRIRGVRIYEWPGTPAYVPGPIPAKGALTYQAKLDGTANELREFWDFGPQGSGAWRSSSIGRFGGLSRM